MDSPVGDKVEASSPLQDESENLAQQGGTSSPILKSTDSNLQDESDDSSVPIWVKRVLAAGRTPLPRSRPPIKAHRMHIADSSRTTRGSSYDSQETELEQPPAQEQKRTAKSKALCPAGNGNPKAKKSNAWSKKQHARAVVTTTPIIHQKVQRKKWTLSEIKSLIRMRENDMSWDVIAGRFSNRTVAGVRQTFFKYKPLFEGMKSGEE
ncbi:hypothetical protein V8C34DRAFT_71251 [Trichoderma compactum]